MATLLNHLSTPVLKDRTPIEKAFGVTPDISALKQFYFYEPVMYLDTNEPSFPHSKELFGHWVGIAENVGDALTYKILTLDLQIICRSTICPAYHPGHQNLRLAEGEFAEGFGPPAAGAQLTDYFPIVDPLQEAHTKPSNDAAISVDPNNIVGFQFVKEHNGFPHRAKVIEPLDEGAKYLFALNDGEREEILTYIEILDYIETEMQQDQDDQAWTFDNITDHRKNKSGKYEILVQWTTGEETWEPLTWIADQDPMTIAMYAKDQGLLDEPGWKRFRRYIQNEKKYIRVMKQIHKTNSDATKIKFGIEVPKGFKDAMRLDKVNGNTLWQTAIETELGQIMDYKTFVDHGKRAPYGHKRIPVHLVFDVKFDLRRKARLVAGGHLTEPIFNDAPYNGIASIKSIRISIFLAKLNGLTIRTADVGNAYLEAYAKEKLYIVAGPEFGELEGHHLVIHKALYGLRTSGARWADHLADSL